MQMFFEASSTVTLLFEFWSVNGPGGMFLSVVVVLLLTVFYEFLKVWSMVLVKRFEPLLDTSVPATCTTSPCSDSPVLEHTESASSLPNSPSQISLAPTENTTTPDLGTSTVKRPQMLEEKPHTMMFLNVMSLNVMSQKVSLNIMSHRKLLFHGVKTLLHIVQVVLGYMLMLCVMSYNVWIFLGVIVGSLLGYFIAFPLLGRYMLN